MFNNNSMQQEITQEKPFIREVIECYEFGDERIDIWNDGEIDLLDKDLNVVMIEEHDPSELPDLIAAYDDVVRRSENEQENSVEM